MGVALLELQLVALEFATAFEFESTHAARSYAPTAGITLGAPPIELAVRVRGLGQSALTKAA
jgi:hypothetical protein